MNKKVVRSMHANVGMPWPWLCALVLVACPWGLPWPWLLAHGGCHGHGSMYAGMPWPWLPAHGGYLGLSCCLLIYLE